MKKDNTNFIAALKFFGWLYFVVWVLGGIFLLFNFKKMIVIPKSYYILGMIEYDYVTYVINNYYYLITAIGGILQAVMILFIMLGIARILENNNENIEQNNSSNSR